MSDLFLVERRSVDCFGYPPTTRRMRNGVFAGPPSEIVWDFDSHGRDGYVHHGGKGGQYRERSDRVGTLASHVESVDHDPVATLAVLTHLLLLSHRSPPSQVFIRIASLFPTSGDRL